MLIPLDTGSSEIMILDQVGSSVRIRKDQGGSSGIKEDQDHKNSYVLADLDQDHTRIP